MPRQRGLAVPKQPELYERQQIGKPPKFFCRFPTVRVTGGRCAGSYDLRTGDRKEAAERMKAWVDSGGLAQIQASDLAAQQARLNRKGAKKKNGTNGHANLPAVIPPGGAVVAKRTYTKRAKEPPVELQRLLKLRAVHATYVHGFAQLAELIDEDLGRLEAKLRG